MTNRESLDRAIQQLSCVNERMNAAIEAMRQQLPRLSERMNVVFTEICKAASEVSKGKARG